MRKQAPLGPPKGICSRAVIDDYRVVREPVRSRSTEARTRIIDHRSVYLLQLGTITFLSAVAGKPRLNKETLDGYSNIPDAYSTFVIGRYALLGNDPRQCAEQ